MLLRNILIQETTSVSTVQNIFKQGKFIISGHATFNESFFLYDTKSKENLYLEGLKELYNRIMLISTERKTDDVDRFSMLFEQLLELNSKLRQICNKSVPLFSLIRICVDCREGTESIKITFDLQSHELSISAHQSTLGHKLTDLSRNLNKILEKWEQEIEDARQKCTLFENFSSVQLINLCHLLPQVILLHLLEKKGSNYFSEKLDRGCDPEVIVTEADSSRDQSDTSFDDNDSSSECDAESLDGLQLPKNRPKSQARESLNDEQAIKIDTQVEILAKKSAIQAKVQWMLHAIDSELSAPTRDNKNWNNLFTWVDHSLSLLNRDVESFSTEETTSAFNSKELYDMGFQNFSGESAAYDYNTNYVMDAFGLLFQSESNDSMQNFHIVESSTSENEIEDLFLNIWTSLMRMWSKSSIIFIGGYAKETINGGLNFESLSNVLILWHDEAQRTDTKLVRCYKPTQILFTKYLSKKNHDTNEDNGITLILPKNRENVIDHVLDISMQSGNLPHPQKTFFAQEDTSFDELRNFLQRFVLSFNAESNNLNKRSGHRSNREITSKVDNNFYYLIHIEKLNYVVAEKGAAFLKEKLMQSSSKGHISCVRLFAFCSEEDARSSVFASSFYSNRIDPPLSPAEKRTQFLYNLIPEYKTRFKCFHSSLSGNGKTWIIRKNLFNALDLPESSYLKILLVDADINETDLCLKLIEFYSCENFFESQTNGYLFKPSRKAIHLVLDQDIRFQNVNTILFKLIVLGQLQTFDGNLWRLGEDDVIYLETGSDFTKVDFAQYIACFRMRTPCQLMNDGTKELSSVPYIQLEGAGSDEKFKFVAFILDTYKQKIKSTPQNSFDQNGAAYLPYKDCYAILQTCLLHCGMDDPSWALLSAFVSFFYQQLKMCENSIFTQLEHVPDIGLSGFKFFVIRFMLQMSRDFATPSINESSLRTLDNEDASFQIRRKWETEAHPYLTFNEDGTTLTFLGFNIQRNTGNLISQNNSIIEQNVMGTSLFDGLQMQGVKLNENFESFSKSKKISKLLAVFGFDDNFCSDECFDPDPGFELTTGK